MISPRVAAWLLAVLTAVAVSANVYRIPIQVSDSLEILEQVDTLPSVSAAFDVGLHASPTMLRPMRQVQTRLLLHLAHGFGDRFNLVFRGYHALTAAVLILLFTALVGPQTWTDVAGFAFGLTVLTGLHTFAGMMREAYPVNHFLLIALACLVTLLLARSRGGLLADVAALICLVFAVLTLESGILVCIAAAAAYIGGWRGISRWALIAMAVTVVGYLILRSTLEMTGNTVGERATGFGLRMLSAAEQRETFGDRPWLLYLYTVAMSVLTVPFSQPVMGQWTVLAALKADMLIRSYLIEIVTSVAATGLIVWFLTTRPRQWMQPPALASTAVLLGSAALSYAYAKSEIMSAAGVLYAVLASAAASEALRAWSRTRITMLTLPALVIVLGISSGWGFRALGLQYKLQRAAYTSRNEWILRMPPFTDPPLPVESLRLAPRLRSEALVRGRTSPFLLSRRAPVYWGEE